MSRLFECILDRMNMTALMVRMRFWIAIMTWHTMSQRDIGSFWKPRIGQSHLMYMVFLKNLKQICVSDQVNGFVME